MTEQQQDFPEIRKKLLHWYRNNRRDLPWRRSADPYAIWVSEIMLQQTRVDAVIPYYERFLRRFPNTAALASAQTEEVLSYWSGLGYYQRARNLHSAVRECVERYNGKVPDNEEEIRTLPGIGPYTAGAILSIAYGKRVPLLDGNVIRLLTRLFALRGDPAGQKLKKYLWELSAALLPQENLSDFNQALMELPALICTPRSPQCEKCPLNEHCLARAQGIAEELPEKAKKEKSIPVELRFAYIEKKGKFLLVQRKENPLKGMWEFPEISKSHSEGLVTLGSAKHSIMSQRITAYYFRSHSIKDADGKWVTQKEMESLPITTLTRKGLAFIAPRI